MKKFTKLLSILSIIIIPLLLFAQNEIPINVKVKTSSEVTKDIDVLTASKQAEKIYGSPAVISVVTKEEIHGFGFTNLSDILNRVSSMYIIQAGNLPLNIASVRGEHTSVYDNHVLILINGRPLRDGLIGRDNIFYASFPVEIIERIEIVRGPGSVLYGSNAFSGVINIITKKEKYINHSIGMNLQYGSFNTFKQSFNGYIGLKNGISLDFAINNMKQDGPTYSFYDSPIGGSQKGTGNFTMENQSAYLNIRYEGFTYTSYFARLNPFTLVIPIKWKYGSFEAGQNKIRKHFFNDIGYTHKFNNKYSLEAKLTSNERQIIGPTFYRKDEFLAVSKNTLLEVTFYANPLKKLNFIAGGYYDNNLFMGKVLISGVLQKYAGYFQCDYTFMDNFKLVLGGQFLKPEEHNFRFIPRVGAILNISNNIGIKALYSNAYRSPYPEETDIISPYYTGSHTLNPEMIATSEFQIFFHNKKARFSATGYYSRMSDMINLVYSQDKIYFNPLGDTVYIKFENTGVHKYYGLEAEGKFSLNEKLSFIGSMILQNNKLNDTLENAAFWPNIIGKFGILYSTYGVTVGLWNSYFGEPTQISNPVVINEPANSYNLLMANITFNLFELLNKNSKYKILFSIYADNILNSKIYYPEFVLKEINAMPLHNGRAIYAKISVKF